MPTDRAAFFDGGEGRERPGGEARSVVGFNPIARFERTLLAEGSVTQARIDEMQKECALIVDDAVDWAEQQPYPAAEEVTKDVYYEG